MPKTVSIANRKGGVGKSWITLCLATELCARGFLVAVVDMDSQVNITKTLKPSLEDDHYTIATLLANQSSIEETIVDVCDNLYLIPGSHELDLFTLNENHTALKNTLASKHLENFDFIIVDTAPGMDNIVVNALVASDFVIAITEAEKHSVLGLKALEDNLELIKPYNENLQLLGVVINKVSSKRNLTKTYIGRLISQYKSLIFSSKISNSSMVPLSLEKNKSIIQAFPESKVAEQIRNLTNEFLARI